MPRTFPDNSQVRFYKDLAPIDDFMDSLDPLKYLPAPASWSVLITDIKGSTKAIEAGKYREVNTLGACTITTAINVLPDLDIPYVFGGDGATLLIPTAYREKLTEELLKLQAYAKRTFSLELRLGIVSIAEIIKQWGEVSVGKYHLGNGNSLALFRWGGISLAEKWIKGKGPNGESYRLEIPENSPAITEPPNLYGLSCRWSPLENKNGGILTLLVKAKNPSEETAVYQEFLDHISLESRGSLQSFCPVQIDGRQFSTYDSAVNKLDGKLQEAGIGRSWRIRSFYLSCITKVAIALDMKIWGFEPSRYIKELAYQVDYKKFDDMLRFVLDCSEEQKKSILAFLEERHKNGRLYYGYHVSQTSLMTCLVFSYEQGRHIHFIDGDHGWYTLAAVWFKAQMKAEER